MSDNKRNIVLYVFRVFSKKIDGCFAPDCKHYSENINASFIGFLKIQRKENYGWDYCG